MLFIMSLSTDIVAIVNVYCIFWYAWGNLLQCKWYAQPEKGAISHKLLRLCMKINCWSKKSLHNGILVSILPKWWRAERAGIILIRHREPHGFISVRPSIAKEWKFFKQNRLEQGSFPGFCVYIYFLRGFFQTIIRCRMAFYRPFFTLWNIMGTWYQTHMNIGFNNVNNQWTFKHFWPGKLVNMQIENNSLDLSNWDIFT